LRSELLLMRLQAQHPHQALLELANSQHPFERWLAGHLHVLLGWNVQELLSEQQHELIFAWPGEIPGSEATGVNADQAKAFVNFVGGPALT
jgi:hypothetical protein